MGGKREETDRDAGAMRGREAGAMRGREAGKNEGH